VKVCVCCLPFFFVCVRVSAEIDKSLKWSEVGTRRMFFALFTVLWVVCGVCEGTVVGAVVLPHGDIALDPARYSATFNKTQLAQAWQLHDCAHHVGRTIAALRPDVLFLDSPHGIADTERLALFLNTRAEGDVETEGEPPGRWNISVTLARDVALDALDALGKALPADTVTGLTAFASDEAFPLRWGEVIPLQFARPVLLQQARVVVATQPTRRLTEPVEMIPALEAAGRALWSFLEARKERVVVIISADLAHTHDAAGPYGYSDAAQPFDDAVAAWAVSLNRTLLTSTAASYAPKALSCGFTGLVMLDALLLGSGVAWQLSLCAISPPLTIV